MKHYVGICLVLATLAGVVLFSVNRCTTAASQAVDHVRDAFASVLQVQPKITVDQRVVFTQTAPIAELAVVDKEELVSLGLNEHVMVGSFQVPWTEKKLSVEATFKLKAGFDLREPFLVTVDPVTHQVQATMPHAKILSVEQVSDLVFHGEDSLLNRITDSERTQILHDLDQNALQAAEASDLKNDADQQVQDRLQQLLHHNGQSLTINWALPQVPNLPNKGSLSRQKLP